MKTTLRITAVALVVLMLAMALASCGNTLSGTYANKEELFGVETGTYLDFRGNKVVMTAIVAGQKMVELEGTYKIDGDKIFFEFDAGDSKYAEYFDDLSGEARFEKGDDYIKIDGIKYEKQ